MIAILSLVVLLVFHDVHVSVVDDSAEAAFGLQQRYQQLRSDRGSAEHRIESSLRPKEKVDWVRLFAPRF
jgi:hypothetical protein